MLSRQLLKRTTSFGRVLQKKLDTHVTINVDAAGTPQRLQQDAEAATRSADLWTRLSVPGRATHAIPLWDELRTWDPGD